jgi:hypothetical protein
MTTSMAPYSRALRFAMMLTLATACGALAIVWPGWLTRPGADLRPAQIIILSARAGAPARVCSFVVQTTPRTSGEK